MDEDIADDYLSYREKRFAALGFYPQKEIYCNKYLPYAEKLDDESQKLLANIKQNLAKAVALREMKPAIGVYAGRLYTYIKLYGLKFSKEDHINFIKLILSLLEIPNLEPTRLNSFCILLIVLLRKTTWLSPNDIEIDWRPLYELSQKLFKKNNKGGDLFHFSPRNKTTKKQTMNNSIPMISDMFLLNWAKDYGFDFSMLMDYEQMGLENNFQYLLQQCAPYFGKNSNEEVIDEIYPKLYPLDIGKSCEAIAGLSLFLNFSNIDHEKWLKDWIHLWNMYHNPSWSCDMMNIISVLARENIGRIDWEPYIPMLFARILRSLDLPVTYKSLKSARNQQLWSSSIAIWIVSTLSPKSSCQGYLTKFLAAIESYLHPANAGKWVNAISEIIALLPKCLTERLVRERYKMHPWKKATPDEHKLTEQCITNFVESLKPIAFQAMYSRMPAQNVGRMFKYLSDLRPEIIIPGVIERVYATLESLTEPHKLTASLQCLVSVSRALVSGHNGYTNGRTHVIPILFATLPGIDPNDFRKTTITLEFFTSFALLLPIIDCSKAGMYYNDLTDEEMLICDQTAEFEIFVHQYLDKVFSLIESSASETVRMEQSDIENFRSRLESLAEASLQSSTHGIMGQCSDEILTSAARKLVDYVKDHLFEPRIAVHLVGSLIRVFTRLAGPLMCKLLVPYLIESIETYISEHDDIADIDKQSDEMLSYIILLHSAVRGNPREIVKIVDNIIPIIDRISKFKCIFTNKYSNGILLNILSNVSTLQTVDCRTSPESFTKPLSEFLPIRHWGFKSNAEIDWYVPDASAKLVCEKLIHRYMPDILVQFEKYVSGKITLTREEILRDSATVLALLKCSNFLPNWDTEEPLKLVDTHVDPFAMDVTIGFEDKAITMPDGSNVRLAVIRTILKLQEKILADQEDDIKSLHAIVLIWERVHMRKQSQTPFDVQLKSFKSVRFFQEYTLTAHKQDIRAIQASRVLMQQDCRDELTSPEFTASHKTIMINLLKLATSHYSAVRSLAQTRLFTMIGTYVLSYKSILDEIINYLALDSNEHHECFKGILFIIGGTRRGRLILQNSWDTIEKLWLALLKTNLSEKPSVVRLMDNINDAMHNEFLTVSIEIHIPDKCVDIALKIAPQPNSISETDIALGREREKRSNAYNLTTYYNILNSILEITHNNSLHWRYGLMASKMIMNLVHPVAYYPPNIVKYCLENLINESIEERKCAIKIVRYIFKQQKPKHVKIPIDLIQRTNGNNELIKPGVRSDNRWLQYDLDTIPKNQSEWDEPRYSHKAEGYFGFSKSFYVYAPFAQQPTLDRTLDEMNEVEQCLFQFITNEANVSRLIEFWSLEEKIGQEKYSRQRFFLIQSFCYQFGDSIVDPFLGHIERLIRAEKNLEASHRCAAEILGGIIRGMKHWPYEKTKNMYDKLRPLILLAMNSITVETDGFWGTCFATASENIEPKKQHWLHEILFDDPLQVKSSFIDCSRIYCLQGPFNQHVWRMNSVSHRLLEYLRPHLSHSFQNTRERLGSLLINIFEGDLQFPGGPEPECPRIKTFIAEVVEKLQILNQVDIVPKAEQSTSSNIVEVNSTAEYDEAVRLFKTVCEWLVGVLHRSTNGNISDYFELLPFACRLERSENDLELASTCTNLLALVSQALTLEDCMDDALAKIDQVSLLPSWSARLSVVGVLQTLVFNNMPIVLSKDEWVLHVQTIVLRLLEDSVLEVREKAAEILGGLIHCSFLPATDKLLDLFKKKCKTKVKKNLTRRLLASMNDNKSIGDSPSSSLLLIERQEAESVRMRHMGVLGLCAFISAYPYDIPDFVPDVFEHLGAHLNDPQPIPSTIRKTVGDFKRTHHENWTTHQLKFTENQLSVLSDLTIPPSYYT